MASDGEGTAQPVVWQIVRRKDVLAGLLFIAVAAIGLWASRNYPIGTATRMGTGYVPRLLCWILLGLGVVVLLQGLRSSSAEGVLAPGPPVRRALIFIPASLVVFAYAIGPLGVVLAIVLLTAVGSLAGRESRLLEVAGAAVVLAVATVAIFIWGIGMPIPIWPEW
jgi:putative tricarboxylic transport membrane protein